MFAGCDCPTIPAPAAELEAAIARPWRRAAPRAPLSAPPVPRPFPAPRPLPRLRVAVRVLSAWSSAAVAVLFVALSGCTNPLPGQEMADMPEWRTAVEGWTANFSGRASVARVELCRAPVLQWVAADEFRMRCQHTACSVGEQGKCAHACAILTGPQAMVIVDEGQGEDFGEWVLVHESLHVLAACTSMHADGDVGHSDARMWGDTMRLAMESMAPSSKVLATLDGLTTEGGAS